MGRTRSTLKDRKVQFTQLAQNLQDAEIDQAQLIVLLTFDLDQTKWFINLEVHLHSSQDVERRIVGRRSWSITIDCSLSTRLWLINSTSWVLSLAYTAHRMQNAKNWPNLVNCAFELCLYSSQDAENEQSQSIVLPTFDYDRSISEPCVLLPVYRVAFI